MERSYGSSVALCLKKKLPTRGPPEFNKNSRPMPARKIFSPPDARPKNDCPMKCPKNFGPPGHFTFGHGRASGCPKFRAARSPLPLTMSFTFLKYPVYLKENPSMLNVISLNYLH